MMEERGAERIAAIRTTKEVEGWSYPLSQPTATQSTTSMSSLSPAFRHRESWGGTNGGVQKEW